MKIAILGAGSWGTTLATILAENNEEVVIWAREKEVVDGINNSNENGKFLPGVKLAKNLKAVSDVKEAVENAEILVAAIPCQFLREKAKEISAGVKEGTIIVNVSKGLENHTFKRMSQVLKEEISQAKVAVLSGPNHAEEVSKKIPTATVIASKEADVKLLQKKFETDYFKVYPHNDVIGLEICGAVKNITAIATGVIHSLGMGDNSQGAIITLGLREMVKLGRHFGATQETFYGIAGVGDLVATCTSELSRNRKVGGMLVKGMDFDKINEEMHGMVAEGIYTCKAVHEYAEKNNINLPLTSQVYKVLFEKKDLKNAIKDLQKLI